ncbi:hypothetical protein JCM17846_30270 [Iodidimonas nitroreducens]|uniref:Uncharacterized protein n=1 Tax=Iodidimonas nitroreducens TaxID=1236968 RepID=A0A5A7NCJ9_9PROT|nr:hypothetical protein [Iodidimonas nitroreducens]GAK32627.1 hypothetical protein AQ1_00494 [alpha proteobacterium Q-1]GER05345.1 hypothetical protein JCM17846_30270 [Iodidimonas nitroreducens]
MVDLAQTGPAVSDDRRRDVLAMRLTLYATFWIFLLAVLLARVVSPFTARAQEHGPRRTVFREAREKALACIPYAFMSW